MILFNSLKQLTKIFPDAYNITENKEIKSFQFDSRKIVKGDIFIALKAERDGHDFVQSAIMNGAVGCIVEKYNPDLGAPQFIVENTWDALETLAKTNREYYKGNVIAVTGSCGKTTIKEMLKACLENSYSTYKNFNGLLGLPITLANLNHKSSHSILELGTDSIGNIGNLTSLAKPDIAIVTSVAPAHLEFFKTIDNIIKEKLSIANGLGVDGIFIIPHEFKEQSKKITEHKPITISLNNSEANCYAKKITTDKIIAVINKKTVEFKLNDIADHKVYNSILTLCVLNSLKLPLNDYLDKISNFEALEGRGQVVELSNNNILTDESYNANPLSMIKTLNAFDNKISNKNKMVILGDMLELGDDSVLEHRRLAKECEEFHTVYTVGPLMASLNKKLDPRARDAQHFHTAQELIEYLSTLRLENFEIFVKGSKGSNVRNVVKFLKQEYNR